MKKKVLEWIKKTGFPLEMEAASAFRDAGFEVRQSFTYPDPQSEKGREIDVLAQDPDWVGIIDISFILECKSSSKPWVVLTSDDALSNYNRLFAFAVTSGDAKNAISEKISEGKELLSYLKRPSRGGYGFRQALGDKSDVAYAAAIGAIKACKGIVTDRAPSHLPHLAVAFPVIVVDSPLFECSLKEDGELQIEEVEKSEFLFSAHIPNEVGCCISVIKKEMLAKFAAEAKQLANTIRQSLKDEENAASKRSDRT